MLFDDDGDGDHGTGLFEDTRRPRREPEPLSPGMRLAWRLGTFLLLLGFVPLVVWVLQVVLRVKKPATGEVDELGRRL